MRPSSKKKKLITPRKWKISYYSLQKWGTWKHILGKNMKIRGEDQKKDIILDISHQTIRTDIFFQQLDVRTKFQYSLSA